jgi:hypothetical protein
VNSKDENFADFCLDFVHEFGLRIEPKSHIGCALTFASEAKFEIEAKISFRLEAKKKPAFT